MWKSIFILLCIMLCATACFAQRGYLTPQHKAVLDLWYLQTNSLIDGALIIDGTITTGKLGFAVVTYEDYTNFYALYLIHTNDASAHHIRFANADETDQVFTSWLGTASVVTSESDPVFTNWVNTNTYVDTFFNAQVNMTSNGWVSPGLTQAIVHLVSGWSQDYVSAYVDVTSTGIVFNLPASRTASVSMTTSISGFTSGGNKQIAHSYYLNTTNLDTSGLVIRTWYVDGERQNVVVCGARDVVNGDIVDFRIVNRSVTGASPATNTIAAGRWTISGFLKR